MDYGENLNQIVKPPEGELFSLFINGLQSHAERQRVYQLYQDVGGPKRINILEPICRRVDDALRPGLGIDDFVPKATRSAAYPIEAISTDPEILVAEAPYTLRF